MITIDALASATLPALGGGGSWSHGDIDDFSGVSHGVIVGDIRSISGTFTVTYGQFQSH